MVVFPWLPAITIRCLSLLASNKYSGYEKTGISKVFACSNSGLSSRACIPKMTASNRDEIFSGNQPISLGKIPSFASLDLEGSKISSSEPVISCPFLRRAMAKLCMALPPIAIK